MRPIGHGRSRGSVVLTVTAVGLFAMLLASQLVNHYVVSEARAVEESLAKVRVYWAAMGHVNYALSRAWREGLCDGTCNDDDDRAADIRRFLDELYNKGGQRNWDYTEYGGGYVLSFTHTVADNIFPNDGYLLLIIDFIDQGDIPSIEGLSDRVRNLAVEVCFGFPCTTNPSGSLVDPTDGIGENDIYRQRRVF